MAKNARRLAAIVAVDIVGYSALTERSAEAAAAAVAQVRAAIERSAARFEGRLFNTAGDGFMLEFARGRDALAFGIDLLRRLEEGPAVRVGADLGEVLGAADGDVLGHSVNVAARLMALAEPRGLMASDVLKAQLSGRLARLFLHQGPVQLDKMRTTVQVYALAGKVGPVGRLRLAVRRPWRAALGAGLAALIGGAAWYAAQERDADPMIAVLPFDAAGGDRQQRMAEGVADDIIMTLTRVEGVGVAARASSFPLADLAPDAVAARLGVRYVLDGLVRHEDGVWRIDAHFIDARRNRTLWAERFQSPDGDVSALQQQIAASVVAAVTGVAAPEAPPAPPISEPIYRLYLEGRRARLTRQPAQVAFAIGALEQVAAQAPDFARGWSELAGAQLIRASQWANAETPDPAAAARLRAAARRSAETALALDPNDGYALAVLAGLEPPGRWRETRALLDRAAAAAPGDANVLRARGNLLSDMGYFNAALADLERARALDPLDPQIALIWTLEALGGHGRARDALARAANDWPQETWNTRLLFALFDRDFAAASALLASPDRPDLSEDALARWRLSVAALQRPRSERGDAVAAWRSFAAASPNRAEDSVLMLSLLGAHDAAFAVGEAAAALTPAIAGAEARLVFRADMVAAPAAAGLMRDPRFADLMTASGLAAYWRSAGHWPDLCRVAEAACARMGAGAAMR